MIFCSRTSLQRWLSEAIYGGGGNRTRVQSPLIWLRSRIVSGGVWHRWVRPTMALGRSTETCPREGSEPETRLTSRCSTTPLGTAPGDVLPNQWDADYIRWLSDPDVTLGKDLRLEIAARLRELTPQGSGYLECRAKDVKPDTKVRVYPQ